MLNDTGSQRPWAPARARTTRTSDHESVEATSTSPVQQRDEGADHPTTLRAVVAMAIEGVERCDLASGILVRDGSSDVVEASEPLAAELDRLQHALGGGPGLEAYETTSIVSCDDLRTDARWPSFTARARRGGIGALVSIPLVPVREFPGWHGWLTLYSREPGPFPAASIALAETLGLYFSTTVNSSLHAESLEAALASRDLIGQAKGIIMARRNLDDADAFAVLQGASQHANRRLRDVAAEVVRSCGRPVGAEQASS